MKKWCIIICTFITLFASGCNRKIEINFNEDYVPFEGYEFEEDDFLMRKGEEEADLLGGIYTLNRFILQRVCWICAILNNTR